MYPQPDVFNPGRHLTIDGQLIPEDSGRITFGFGRRACPGKGFAEDSLWLIMAQVLSVFDITPFDSQLPQPKFSLGTIS